MRAPKTISSQLGIDARPFLVPRLAGPVTAFAPQMLRAPVPGLSSAAGASGSFGDSCWDAGAIGTVPARCLGDEHESCGEGAVEVAQHCATIAHSGT